MSPAKETVPADPPRECPTCGGEMVRDVGTYKALERPDPILVYSQNYCRKCGQKG